MKTLEQIEPPKDVDTLFAGLFSHRVINTPGSYYLSGNLSCSGSLSCIEIRASGVTLDLNGFSITRTGDGQAIVIGQGSDALTNITIKNGHITGPNVISGISVNTSEDPTNVRVTGVSVSNVSQSGINLGPDISNSVDHCSVRVVGGAGITAGEISHSTALACASTALRAYGSVSHSRWESTGSGIDAEGTVSDSTGMSTGASTSADGIRAMTVSNSWGDTTGGDGIIASRGVSNSYGRARSAETNSDGIHCFGGTVVNSTGEVSQSGGFGIYAPNTTVSYSYAISNGVAGLRARIAIGCTTEGGESITNKYLMP